MGKRTNNAVWMEKYRRWQIKVQKDKVRKTFTSATPGRAGLREANAKADAWLDDNIDSGRLRIDQLCDDYIADLKLRTSKSHWRMESSRVETWIKPRMGTLRPEKVNEQTCQDIINAAYSQGLSRKTIMNIRSTLTAFFKYCRKRKACAFRPEDLDIPRGAEFKERTILQPNDLIKLFSVDTTVIRGKVVVDEYINFYRFAVVTGLRPGEVLGVMTGDINNNILRVGRSINVYGEITPGKNKNAIRTQELTPIAKAILDSQAAQSDGLYIFGGISEGGLLKRWHRYCEVNGLSQTTLYELRHTFVSAIQSLPEAYIKNLVGHSVSMDTGTYTHQMDDTQKKIADEVQRVFLALLEPVKQIV